MEQQKYSAGKQLHPNNVQKRGHWTVFTGHHFLWGTYRNALNPQNVHASPCYLPRSWEIRSRTWISYSHEYHYHSGQSADDRVYYSRLIASRRQKQSSGEVHATTVLSEQRKVSRQFGHQERVIHKWMPSPSDSELKTVPEWRIVDDTKKSDQRVSQWHYKIYICRSVTSLQRIRGQITRDQKTNSRKVLKRLR